MNLVVNFALNLRIGKISQALASFSNLNSVRNSIEIRKFLGEFSSLTEFN